MSTLVTILITILLFGILILVHEAGHFFAGRMVGIRPQEFSIGMGPVLLSKEKKGTKYSLRLLPIGGSVRFLGEDEENPESGAFNNAPVWRRIFTIAAGPIMNFLLGVVLIMALYMAIGVTTIVPVVDIYNPAELFAAHNPAKEAGILPGDRLVGVNGEYWGDLDDDTIVMNVHTAIESAKEAPVDIIFERGGDRDTATVTPIYNPQDNAYQIGIQFKKETVKIGFFKSVAQGFKVAISAVAALVSFLVQLIFRGQGAGEVLGPVGIMTEIGNAVRMGWENVLNLAIIISLNLALINLIPFPALDGGRIVLLAAEGIRGKPLNREREGFIHLIGFAVLMILMILVTYRDIVKLFTH